MPPGTELDFDSSILFKNVTFINASQLNFTGYQSWEAFKFTHWLMNTIPTHLSIEFSNEVIKEGTEMVLYGINYTVTSIPYYITF